MSWQAMDAVDKLSYDVVKPLAYRVLVKLANVADQTGKRAFRSKWEMADELGVSERSIQRALQELEQLHIIRKGDQKYTSHLRGGYRPTVYDINMGFADAAAQAGVQTLDDGLSDTPEAGETRGETEISTGTGGETRGETTAVVHKELRELTTKTKKEALDPNVSARASVPPAILRTCVPPYRSHDFDPLSGNCKHGCGVRANGEVIDLTTMRVIVEAHHA